MVTINQNIQRERRKLLIDATITAIAEFGLSKLTLAKISSIAGLTAGTVNFHFESKESLLLETLNFVSEEFDQSIARALEEAGSNPSKRLESIINASLDPEITEHRKMAVWFAFDSESLTRDDYQLICGKRDRENFELIFQLCEQIIRQENMEDKINARGVTNAISGLTEELWKEILFAGETYNREEAKKICMSFLASIFPWCYEMPQTVETVSNHSLREPIHIIKAGKVELDQAAMLFDLYRQFYQQKANFSLAKKYLEQMLTSQTSVIYLAKDDVGNAIGFTQLYPSYCSVAAEPILILYDLYVKKEARNSGVAKALMNQALQLAKETGASRIDLETAIDNTSAQSLYESLGYERDIEFHKYSLEL